MVGNSFLHAEIVASNGEAHPALQYEERFPETSKPRFLPGAYLFRNLGVCVW